MEFQKFGIDSRLAAAAERLRPNAFFHEKMLDHVIKMGENVCAKVSLDEGLEEACLLPALQWLAAASPDSAASRVLILVPDRPRGDAFLSVAEALGASIGATGTVVADLDAFEGADPSAEAIDARIVIGVPDALLAAAKAGVLRLREFGFVISDSTERLGELPADLLRKLIGSLLPSWERRTLLSCARLTVKAKNLAWDLADNPSEIAIDGAVSKAQSVARETWRLAAEDKLKFLLGLLSREKPAKFCVFCNLKDTAADASKRLEANGIRSDFILGSLAIERKLELQERIASGSLEALVLTDQGAEGLSPSTFPFVVNFDIPLEPEYFVKRLEMLDRSAPGAKVVNLACDRYIFGLTAVEQHIGAKLDVTEVDASLLTAEDKSAAMVFERRDRGERSDRGDRGDRRDRERGSEREGSRRDATRDGRNPEIRRSIADATGGSLDIGDAPPAAPPAGPSAKPPAPPPKARDAGRGRDGRRGASRQAGGPQARGEGGVRREGRQAGRREENRRPAERSSPAGAGNPYDLPMEERMRRYREKYGRRLSDERSDVNRGAAPLRTGKPRRDGAPRPAGQSIPRRAADKPLPAPERSREGGEARGNERPGTRDALPRGTSQRDSARGGAARSDEGPIEAPKGVLSRVFGFFKKKDPK